MLKVVSLKGLQRFGMAKMRNPLHAASTALFVAVMNNYFTEMCSGFEAGSSLHSQAVLPLRRMVLRGGGCGNRRGLSSTLGRAPDVQGAWTTWGRVPNVQGVHRGVVERDGGSRVHP